MKKKTIARLSLKKTVISQLSKMQEAQLNGASSLAFCQVQFTDLCPTLDPQNTSRCDSYQVCYISLDIVLDTKILPQQVCYGPRR